MLNVLGVFTAVDSTLDSTVLAGADVQEKHSTFSFHACVFLLVICV